MTCIVGFKKDGVVYMGGDSVGVGGGQTFSNNYPKVFERYQNGISYLFGYTSSFRMGQIIQYNFNIPRYIKNNYTSIMAYLCKEFIPSLRSILKEHGYTTIDNNEEIGGDFLLGFQGRLFTIKSDFQVFESQHPFSACGCGEQYALGNLIDYTPEDDPYTTIELALSAAEEFCNGVKGPYVFIEGGGRTL